jgi:hypothetical protein
MGMGERCPYDIVNKTALTGASHSPCSRVAPSPPKSRPAILLQVPLPRPQFNGHKPSSIEGEERLDSKGSAINKTDMSVAKDSLNMPETVLEQSQANKYCEQLKGTVHSLRGPSLLWTCSVREPFCGAQRGLVDGTGAEIQHPIGDINIINGKNEMSVL